MSSRFEDKSGRLNPRNQEVAYCYALHDLLENMLGCAYVGPVQFLDACAVFEKMFQSAMTDAQRKITGKAKLTGQAEQPVTGER